MGVENTFHVIQGLLLLTHVKSRVNYQVECLPVSHGLGDGVDDDRQISTHVVHQEQEESDAGSSHLRITNLREKQT